MTTSRLRFDRTPESDDCVSDLTLDALLADELSGTSGAGVHAHVAGCPRCRARLTSLGEFKASIDLPGFPRVPAGKSRKLWFVQPRVAAFAAALTLAASVVLWFEFSGSERSSADGRATRTKGSARLGFYVRRESAVFRGGPGEVLRPGDALEFSFVAPRAGFVAVLSVDGGGRASVYYPSGVRAARIEAGEQLLPQSTVLDHVLGKELLFGVFCDGNLNLEQLRLELQSLRRIPDLPGCSVDQLEVDKRVP